MQESFLQSSDILDYQDMICSTLRQFFHFDGHTLYFPTTIESNNPCYIAREHKLLIPLIIRRTMLGMLVLHKVRARSIKPILPFLNKIIVQILENIAKS
ncbi:MAG: diguanylate cyclase, partial [Desulfovibrio sp.]|nr:diguanylate cyclase [Desulfovibrio sp.]